MKTITSWTAAITLTLTLAALAFAGVPQTINYQGYLKDTNGLPVSTQVDITFRLYADTNESAVALWSETQSVTPQNGIYSVRLGNASSPLFPQLFENGTLYLGVQINGNSEMSLRQQILSVPFSLRAETAETVSVNGVNTSAIIDGAVTAVKLAAGSVMEPHIAPGSITADKLAANAVTSGSIAWHSITPDRLDTPYVKTTGDNMSGPLTIISADSGTIMDIRATNNSSTAEAVKITNSGKGNAFSSYAASSEGNAGLFSTIASLNNSNTLSATTVGGGDAGTFTIFNAASTGSALHASTNGTGDAIQAVNSGSGLAGHFLGDVTITGALNIPPWSINTQALQDGAVTNVKIGSVILPAKGGTGINTSATAIGSTLYTSSLGSWSVLPIGTAGQVLKVADGVPSWGNVGTLTSITAGTGLSATPSPITASGTLSIDTAIVPRLATGNLFTGTQGILTGTPSAPGMIIMGVAGQSANLQEWQNNSGNAVVASISPTGTITSGDNIQLPIPTSSTGIIYSGSARLVHSFDLNFFAGRNAGNPSATGIANTGIGDKALALNISGAYNTAIGSNALSNNVTGYENTVAGQMALVNNNSGFRNTAIGSYSGNKLATGSQNTFLGSDSDVSTADLSNATAIGYGAIADASNKVRIGNAAVTVIGGQVAWSTLSDLRQKKDVADATHGLDFIKQLRPVEYRMKGGNNRKDFGFIAQEVESLLGANYNLLGIGADTDRTLTLRYTDFIAPMVKAMQEQQTIIEQLKSDNAAFKADNTAFKALLCQDHPEAGICR